MRVHVEILAALQQIWGAFGVMLGIALGVLAVGTDIAAIELGSLGPGEQAGVWVLSFCAVAIGGLGLAMLLIGRALPRRAPRMRRLALWLTLPNLVLVPFGTALAIYTIWVLQNDDARRQFGSGAVATGSAS